MPVQKSSTLPYCCNINSCLCANSYFLPSLPSFYLRCLMTFISYCCESICCSCQAMSVMLMVKCDILILCRPQTDTFLRLWQGRIWAASVRPARSLRCRSLSPSQNHHTKMMVQSTYGSNCSSIILLFRDPVNFTSWFKTVCWMLNYEFKEVEKSKRIKS